MAKALVHFADVKLAPIPIVVPDQMVSSEPQLRDYLFTWVTELKDKMSQVRCIWYLDQEEGLRAYFPTASKLECRTYSEDEMITASLDPKYSSLLAAGRQLQMLEEAPGEPRTRRSLAELRVVGLNDYE
ncbi:MAG: hypothetical protein AB1489_35055 [Acidobacteriota bacterium]